MTSGSLRNKQSRSVLTQDVRPVVRSLLIAFIVLVFAVSAQANPYLPKPGEKPVKVRIATCAVSGGFAHLYTAIDYGIFEKYGIKMEHVFIRGSNASLAALAADEIQFLYCAAEATMPALATGIDAKLVAAPLVKLPYVLVTRREIKRPTDLKGKSLGVTRPGDLSARLSLAVLKKFNMADEVTVRPIGGSQSERYQAMAANMVQGVVVTPPLDVRAKNDGFNVLYRLVDLDLPFIYSSVHANSKILREQTGSGPKSRSRIRGGDSFHGKESGQRESRHRPGDEDQG